MAWNEPGGNNRDPWGSNGRDQGPPDLDELVRKLSNKLGGLFGGRKGGVPGGGGGGGGMQIGMIGFLLIGLVLLTLWLLSGLYTVEQGNKGVELRFGRFSDITEPGLSYHWPYPIESVEIVNVEQVRQAEIGYRSSNASQQASRSIPNEALMLTEDENIVDVSLSVQYRVSEPKSYLFNVLDPDATLRQVVESTTREVVGKSSMDFVLTEGRSDIVAEIKENSQDILDDYRSGLTIQLVNLQDAQPPDEVQDAFADAIKAREDEQRLINVAEAYRNEVLPRARGEAARQLQEAEAYREQVIAQAEGEARRFEQLLTEYKKAPDVTRERLYLETMENVLDNSNVVLMGAENKNNLMLLPLDQMLQRNGSGGGTPRRTPSLIEPPLSGAGSASNGSQNSGLGSSRLRPSGSGRAREER